MNRSRSHLSPSCQKFLAAILDEPDHAAAAAFAASILGEETGYPDEPRDRRGRRIGRVPKPSLSPGCQKFLAAILDEPDHAGAAAFAASILGEDTGYPSEAGDEKGRRATGGSQPSTPSARDVFIAAVLREHHYNPNEPRDERGRWTTGGPHEAWIQAVMRGGPVSPETSGDIDAARNLFMNAAMRHARAGSDSPFDYAVVRPGDVFRVDNMPFFDKPGDSFSPIELAAGDEGSDGKTPPYTPDWYVRAKGEAVGDAGGTVTLKDGRKINIEVTKNDDIQRWHDGAIVKNDQGKPATVPGLLQFKATGTDCDDCRWVQFYKNFETDKDGKPIGGLNADWNAYNFVSGNGQWVVDASHPGPGQNVDPNVIYQDQGDSLFNRSKTETSVFDRPNIKTTPETSERGADFKTYLVADGKPVWEINWKAVARPTPGQPDPSTTYEAISGKQVSQFAPELNTKTWDVGYHVKTDGDKATISRDLTKIANPFYSR